MVLAEQKRLPGLLVLNELVVWTQDEEYHDRVVLGNMEHVGNGLFSSTKPCFVVLDCTTNELLVFTSEAQAILGSCVPFRDATWHTIFILPFPHQNPPQ